MWWTTRFGGSNDDEINGPKDITGSVGLGIRKRKGENTDELVVSSLVSGWIQMSLKWWSQQEKPVSEWG